MIDHFIFEHPSNATSCNEQCIQKLIAQPSVFFKKIEGPVCRWHLLLGESGFVREATSWLTNHPDFAEALVKWREGVAGVEPDRHMQVNSGLASVQYLVESCLKVIRRDLQSNEELSDVAAFSAHLADGCGGRLRVEAAKSSVLCG